MSEGQSATAASLESIQSLEPTAEDIELLHRIVLRAQQEPLENDRLSLLSAYEATLRESGIDPKLDQVCYWLILEISKPEIEGDRLYTKFENVLRRRGMEVVFTDDETSTKGTVPSSVRENYFSRRHSVPSSSISPGSYQPSHAPMYRSDHLASIQKGWETAINDPSPQVAQLMQQAIRMDRNALIRQCIQMFQDHQRAQQLEAMEQTAGRIYERKLKFKVLSHWYNLQQQIRSNYIKAHAHYVQHQALSTLGNLLDSARVNRMHAMENERLRGMGLYKMAVAAREASFCRKVNFRVKQHYVRLMLEKMQSRSTHGQALEGLLRKVQPRFNARVMRTAVAAIRSTSGRLDSINSFADARCESKLKSLAVEELVKRTQQMSSNTAIAQSFREQSLMRKYFARMKESVRVRVLRRKTLMRTYFKKWREKAQNRKRQRLKTLHLEYRRRYKMQLARKALISMADKVRNIQHLQNVAIESQMANFSRFTHDIVIKWYHRSHHFQNLETEATRLADKAAAKRVVRALTDKQQQLRHLDQVADQFRLIHTQSASANCLKVLSRKSFGINRRQQDADAFRTRHNRQTVRIHVDRLRRKAAENRGEGPLVLPPATPAQRRADQLNRLASTTPLLAPKTSFAARLRGEMRSMGEIDEEVTDDG